MRKLSEFNILVVGDIMVDHYIVGEVERISPEAPVPVVRVTDEYYTLGGCGNVVRNLRELGVGVDCLASVAWDEDGEMLQKELDNIGANSLIVNESKVTTVKKRVIADERKIQMLRIDKEDTRQINPNVLINRLASSRTKYDIIIISDYAKGMISQELMDYLRRRKIKIIVDPKPQHKNYYHGVYMITPNEKEWQEMKDISFFSKDDHFVLETLGSKGMRLFNLDKVLEIPSEPVKVYNVSGAGDTVVAIIAVCLATGLDPYNSAIVANKCAGYVVTQPGTTVVPQDIFLECLVKQTTQFTNS